MSLRRGQHLGNFATTPFGARFQTDAPAVEEARAVSCCGHSLHHTRRPSRAVLGPQPVLHQTEEQADAATNCFGKQSSPSVLLAGVTGGARSATEACPYLGYLPRVAPGRITAKGGTFRYGVSSSCAQPWARLRRASQFREGGVFG